MKHADAISHKVNTFPAKILLQAVYLMFLNVQPPVISSLFAAMSTHNQPYQSSKTSSSMPYVIIGDGKQC